jgi:hypothetical protein
MRKFILTLLVASLVAFGGCAVKVDDDEKSPSPKVRVPHELRQAASLGCVEPSFAQVGSDWDLINTSNREHSPGIGTVRLFKSTDAASDIWCVTTYSGPRTDGHWKFALAQITWYNPGDTKVDWPQGKSPLRDEDQAVHYVGGVTATIPPGKCLAVRGFVAWKGYEFWRSIMTEECN